MRVSKLSVLKALSLLVALIAAAFFVWGAPLLELIGVPVRAGQAVLVIGLIFVVFALVKAVEAERKSMHRASSE